MAVRQGALVPPLTQTADPSHKAVGQNLHPNAAHPPPPQVLGNRLNGHEGSMQVQQSSWHTNNSPGSPLAWANHNVGPPVAHPHGMPGTVRPLQAVPGAGTPPPNFNAYGMTRPPQGIPPPMPNAAVTSAGTPPPNFNAFGMTRPPQGMPPPMHNAAVTSVGTPPPNFNAYGLAKPPPMHNAAATSAGTPPPNFNAFGSARPPQGMPPPMHNAAMTSAGTPPPKFNEFGSTRPPPMHNAAATGAGTPPPTFNAYGMTRPPQGMAPPPMHNSPAGSPNYTMHGATNLTRPPQEIPPPRNVPMDPPTHFPPAAAPRPEQAGDFPSMASLHHNLPVAPNPSSAYGGNNLAVNDEKRPINLLQEKRLLPPKKNEQKPLRFDSPHSHGGLVPPERQNCSPDVFRCTMNAFPCSQALLSKVKLPLGLIVHPYKDLSSLPVISAGTIVRCKRCRTYINPFVDFLDERRWRCNLCFVVNDVPEEFLHHPVTRTYGEPHTRPECTNATLEFIAPQEYMVRPPQPAVYLFMFDVSHSAVESGYLSIVCDVLLEHIDHLPGDSRTKIGFISYNGAVHFYRMEEESSCPKMLIVSDVDDMFTPTPDCLLVNLHECREQVCELLRQLPEIHLPASDHLYGEVQTQSALGAALQIAHKLMSAYGGRITVFQQSLPTVGPGALKARESRNSKGGGDSSVESLNPSTDFYKKLALDCSAHQIAIDFFFLSSQYIDISTLSCASRFSAGDLHYYPGLHTTYNPLQAERLQRDLDRYLTRKIGFEAVMRIRCTRGINIHTFHGNFFVRSTDLLALANINPDAGYGLNLSIEESLADLSSVCVQAALLYTSSKGERRIRVHTMCFPVTKHAEEVFRNIDTDAVVTLLSKMAVDRSIVASISDAKDALLNAVIDPLKVYKETVAPTATGNVLLVPSNMRTFPLMMSCLFKHPAFRTGVSTRLDDRVFAMVDLKGQPTAYALQSIHPDLYRVDSLTDQGGLVIDDRVVPQPELLPLSAESICRGGVYLLDTGWLFYLYVSVHTSQDFLLHVLGVNQFSQIQEPMCSLPDLDNPTAEMFHNFVEWLQDQRPHHAPIQVVREDSRDRHSFMRNMKQDKTESLMSLQEFLQHVTQQINR